jgi:hypothetical protein
MKKFFAIAIIAASLAACNNSGDSTKTSDSTTVTPDTASTMAPDTTSKMSDTSKMSMDTTSKKK